MNNAEAYSGTAATQVSLPVKVHVGLGGGEPAATVPRDKWKLLVQTRRSNCLTGFRHDCRALVFYVEDAAANGWLGFKDRDAYIRDGLGLQPDAVDLAVEGLSRVIGEAISFDSAVVLGQRERGVVGGKPGPGRGNKTGSNTTRLGRGAEYTVARLRRDAPELAAKVEAGEVSAHAAAIEAGFRKATVTVAIEVPAVVAMIRKNFTNEQQHQIVDALRRDLKDAHNYAIDIAAARVGVPRRAVEYAMAVAVRDADPSLFEQLSAGTIEIDEAHALIRAKRAEETP